MDTVFPYLVQEDLLTQDEQEKLCSISSTMSSDKKKITYLVNALPQKGSTALPRFLKCLECTASGTAHNELADFIRSKVDQVREHKMSSPAGMICMTCIALYYPHYKNVWNVGIDPKSHVHSHSNNSFIIHTASNNKLLLKCPLREQWHLSLCLDWTT